MFCEKCGAAIPEGTRFCTVCGEPVRGAAPSDPQGGKGGPRWSKIVIVVSIVVIVAAALIIGWTLLSPQSTGSSSVSSTSGSSDVAASSSASASAGEFGKTGSAASESASSASIVSRETQTWFGSVAETDGKTSVASFKGIEGAFTDPRGEATQYHGYYVSLELSNSKVAADGKSGTCDFEMSWVPESGRNVSGSVAQFKATMTLTYDAAHPDVLTCSVDSGTLVGKATLSKDKFQWAEGWMKPGYTDDPGETVDLTRELKRAN